MKVAALFVILSVLALGAYAANYAVLVAGSASFGNYRHQSDTAHAYQILIKNGVPAANIIVMMYDDVANDPQNPFKGTLFNKPDKSGKGVNNYAGLVIDYKKGDVTPANFLAIITGNKSAVHGGNGKVLTSTAADNVFIYFTDHGATGLIAFPSEYLYADDLLKAMATMTTKQMYNKFVFYLEACESGSMFVDLPKNTKIYATTAANPDESSWAYYCSPDDIVNNKEIGSCLGDEYSIRWLEDSDAANMKSETLQTQFTNVKKLTLQSHVMQYGDQSYTSDVIGNFQSGSTEEATIMSHPPLKMATEKLRLGAEVYEVPVVGSRVDSRDAVLMYLIRKHQRLNTVETETELKAELDQRAFFNSKFGELKVMVGVTDEDIAALPKVTDYACLKASVAQFESQCNTKLSDYGLKFVRTLATICEKGLPIESAINVVCQ